MKLNKIYSAILLSTLPLTPALAAGLDRSGQSIAAFLQPGNYAEAGISVLDPTVKGKDISGNKVEDMGDDYYFPSAAIKVQATDKISLGLLYDQPYGADATYQVDGSDFSDGTEGTKVEVRTHNLTALIGYQPTENWNIYAGPVWQTVEAEIKLYGAAYKALSGYNIKIEQEEAFGWLAGFAYQIPEIALKASITYRSEIKHNASSTETSKLPFGKIVNSPVEAITPQSVNLDLQTGIAKNTLAFANLRWVHWDNFVVSPELLSHPLISQNLIDYSDDQYSATVGLGHKFSSKWSGSASVGWDSGAGNPVTTLGPVEGFWSVGLGGQYSPAENYFIQAGVKYFWLGDAKAKRGTDIVGDFEDNHALGYGMKIGYRF
ncbi:MULTISPECIES: OmpP1/FadL family transporter [Acinetobacter]|uniref:OmpP1/FadL family transporter n=1 Tax=Acinetobacter TaxID=469 RepID=UPI0015D273D7|nr:MULTISPECIES: outer membrane protein transport protein [Acinetobacter]MCA4798318.1 outer membrane protein transport protein [Acinetobacter towneri]MCO8047308.1 outer membrane protein transport protein [Acinetobacter towneri]MCO8058737.1 outer membrane protein transport protein [Acinetobacter towneri]MCO8064495.1 outer membrane protein transport protein [Acinetobacter towneri]